MSNSGSQFSPTSRALLIGAMVGGAASASSQWKAHKAGEIETNQMVAKAAKDSVKAALVSGATTYVATQTAGRPLLSLVTVLSVGAAGLYAMSHYSGSKGESHE